MAKLLKTPDSYKRLRLKPLTIHPIASLNRYHDLMTKCLTAGNIEAHYGKGIQEYFEKTTLQPASNIYKHPQKDHMKMQYIYME